MMCTYVHAAIQVYEGGRFLAMLFSMEASDNSTRPVTTLVTESTLKG
jgi:hypothetical protein